MQRGFWLIFLLLFAVMPIYGQEQDDASDPLVTMVAPPTIQANVQDYSSQLEATLKANNTSPAQATDQSAALDATLKANDQAPVQATDQSAALDATLNARTSEPLVPPQTNNDLSDYLPTELRAQQFHSVLVFIAIVVLFIIVWKLRRNAVIDYGDMRKKKKKNG